MKRRKGYILVTAFGILIIGTIAILSVISWSTNINSTNQHNLNANSSNINYSKCPTMSEIINTKNSLKFYPIKIVVEPWRGKHHVYAIFAVPLEYQAISYRSRMFVKGSDTPWYITLAKENIFNVKAPEGSFLLVGFFRTRLALWYWLSGRFGDLYQPCNWTLQVFP